MTNERIVDLTQTVGADTPVYPGDGPVRTTILAQGSINLSRIELSLHTGTHMDAPFHFFGAGETIDCVALDRCLGPARLIDVQAAAAGGEIRREHIQQRADQLRAHAAILCTGWAKAWGSSSYFTGHPALAADAAEYLVACGVRLVGVDMPSVDHAPYPAHRILLGAGVPIVENLTNLDGLGVSRFHIVVLPLKLAGRDGSPVRAIALI